MTSLLLREPTDCAPACEPEIELVADVSCGYWSVLDRSDDSLLDFDQDLPNAFADVRTLLQLHPVVYRNHLAIAKFLDGWIDRIASGTEMGPNEIAYVQALVEIATALRVGDFTDTPPT